MKLQYLRLCLLIVVGLACALAVGASALIAHGRRSHAPSAKSPQAPAQPLNPLAAPWDRFVQAKSSRLEADLRAIAESKDTFHRLAAVPEADRLVLTEEMNRLVKLYSSGISVSAQASKSPTHDRLTKLRSEAINYQDFLEQWLSLNLWLISWRDGCVPGWVRSREQWVTERVQPLLPVKSLRIRWALPAIPLLSLLTVTFFANHRQGINRRRRRGWMSRPSYASARTRLCFALQLALLAGGPVLLTTIYRFEADQMLTPPSRVVPVVQGRQFPVTAPGLMTLESRSRDGLAELPSDVLLAFDTWKAAEIGVDKLARTIEDVADAAHSLAGLSAQGDQMRQQALSWDAARRDFLKSRSLRHWGYVCGILSFVALFFTLAGYEQLAVPRCHRCASPLGLNPWENPRQVECAHELPDGAKSLGEQLSRLLAP